MMMPRKKRRTIQILIIIVIIAIIVGAFLGLYYTTDMFKSNKTLFTKYAGQLLDNLEVITNEANMAEMEEILHNNKLVSDSTAMIQYSEDGNTDAPINNVQINVASQEEETAGYVYRDITMTQNDETLAGLEYIEDEDISGVRLNGIRQYLSTDIQNDNKISQINSLVNLKIKDLIGFTSEEINTLEDKYLQIIMNDIDSATYTKQSNVNLEIDGQTYTTNGYTVTITKEQFNNIYIKILESLKEDEIVLSKIENIDNQINTYYNIIESNETSNIRQEFIDKIETKITKIQNTNIGNNQRTITVYESNGVAISLAIDTEENFAGLDVVNINGKNFINILGNEKIEEDEKENSFDLKLEKTAQTNDEEIKITYNIVEEGKETTNEFKTNRKMENSQVTSNIEITRNVNNNQVAISIEKNTEVVNNFEEKEELVENENNILLENLTDEQKESVKNTLTQNVTEQINRVLQVVSWDSVKNMLVNIDIIKAEAENIENEGITEAERNRFNSDFELFEGENITKERVIELMNIAKESLEDIRITQYKEQNNSSDERIPAEYRLVIRGNTENATLAEQFVSYIEEGNDNNFSVRLEYDEETGLVNNVYITIME